MKAIIRRRRPNSVLWLLAVGFVTGLVIIGAAAGGRSMARAGTQANAMAVDADPSTAVVDASAARPVGAEFDVGVSVTAAGAPYKGYGVVMRFDSSRLAWIEVPPNGFVYVNSGSHGMTLEANASLAGGDTVRGGAARQGDPITFVGGVALVRFKCIASGPASLHLLGSGEAVSFTNTLSAGGGSIPTSLTDAQITCGEGGPPVPTASGATATPVSPGATPVPPGATPAGPQATPTPLPPGMEAVGLAAGCNPVTSTYPDATPIQTIAGAVGPAGNLISLWMFDAGTWRAFSPQYPQASDLTEVDLLDVMFACVGGPGDFVRPIV